MLEEEKDDLEAIYKKNYEIITKTREKVDKELAGLSEVERNKVADRIDMLSRRIRMAESILLVWLRDWILSNEKPVSAAAFALKREEEKRKERGEEKEEEEEGNEKDEREVKRQNERIRLAKKFVKQDIEMASCDGYGYLSFKPSYRTCEEILQLFGGFATIEGVDGIESILIKEDMYYPMVLKEVSYLELDFYCTTILDTYCRMELSLVYGR